MWALWALCWPSLVPAKRWVASWRSRSRQGPESSSPSSRRQSWRRFPWLLVKGSMAQHGAWTAWIWSSFART
eukprot:1114801-Pyramimonas_sp.AAC.1